MTAPPSTPPLIEVVGLVKRYDGKTVLDGIDLTFERGETVVLIGGSGSGKSTFARVLIGLEPPTAGRVLIEGVDMASLGERELTEIRLRFAMVFQKHALLDSMTVFDNVAFPLREETDLDGDAIEQRVMFALGELGVATAANKLPSELSGGMAKRVAIARAIVTEPEIIVYDEPTSGLDPVTSRVVDDLIERMREEHLVTSLVITHDMVTAYEVADRVVLLEGGKIVAQGPPDEIFRSHNGFIRPFAVSSGIDLDHLMPRASRKSAEEIRALWLKEHGALPRARRRRWSRWRRTH